MKYFNFTVLVTTLQAQHNCNDAIGSLRLLHKTKIIFSVINNNLQQTFLYGVYF